VTRSDSDVPAEYPDTEFNPASDYADEGFLAAWPQLEDVPVEVPPAREEVPPAREAEARISPTE